MVLRADKILFNIVEKSASRYSRESGTAMAILAVPVATALVCDKVTGEYHTAGPW